MVAGEGGRRLIGRNEGVDYRLRDWSISSTGAMNRELVIAVLGWFDRGRWCSYLEGVICCKRRKDGVWMLIYQSGCSSPLDPPTLHPH